MGYSCASLCELESFPVADDESCSWIDLPAESKLCPPSYQELNASEIPSTTHGEGVEIKVICGEAEDLEGNVTKSPVKPLGGCWYFDVTVQNGKEVWQKIPSGWNAFVS